MSAAEKLKALAEEVERSVLAEPVLRRALPQIVAVVEAAEQLADSTDDDWFYSGGRAQTMRALAALDEVLP